LTRQLLAYSRKQVLQAKVIDLNQVVRAYDYRKFTTEVKNAEVKDVAKP